MFLGAIALADDAKQARQLIELLARDDQAVRDLVLRELGKLPAGIVIAELEHALLEAEVRLVREWAARLIGERGSAAVGSIPVLVRAQADRYVSVREAAEAAITRVGKPLASQTAVLTQLLEHAVDKVREVSAKALAAIGPPAASATPVLLAMMDKVEISETRLAMLDALIAFGKGGLPGLIQATASKDIEIRRRVVDTIAALGSDGAAALPRLRELVRRDADGAVQTRALDAIAKVANQKELLATALEILGDDQLPAALWSRALTHILQQGPAASSLTSLLLTQLERDDAVRRKAAIAALPVIGKPERVIVTALMAQLTSDVYRDVAGTALVKVGAGSAASLQRLLKHRDALLRKTATELLGRIAEVGSSSAPLLIELLVDRDESVRVAAANALTALGASSCQPLLARYRRGDRAVKIESARLLGSLGVGASDAAETLLADFTTIDPDLKLALRGALKRIASEMTDRALAARIEAALRDS
jgi:HEAT repeat protein